LKIVGNSNKLYAKITIILLATDRKNLVVLPCETRKFKKSAFAVPILDDKHL